MHTHIRIKNQIATQSSHTTEYISKGNGIIKPRRYLNSINLIVHTQRYQYRKCGMHTPCTVGYNYS